MNLGVLAIGVVGGGGLWIGLAAQERAQARRRELLRTHGVPALAVVVAVGISGRYAAFRDVVMRLPDGREISQSFAWLEAQELGLVEGASVRVRHLPHDTSVAMVDVPEPAPSRFSVPAFVGIFIATLGLLAALVV